MHELPQEGTGIALWMSSLWNDTFHFLMNCSESTNVLYVGILITLSNRSTLRQIRLLSRKGKSRESTTGVNL